MSISIDPSNYCALVTGVSSGSGWDADLNYKEIANYSYNPNIYLLLFYSGWEKQQTMEKSVDIPC